MALIAMAVYCTEENQKAECLRRTLYGLYDTVDISKHRIVIVDNGSCDSAKRLYTQFSGRHFISKVIYNDSNIGTARAINKAWALREPGEHLIKMDDDIVIFSNRWADEMEEAIRRDPTIGQVGLKRKDCWERPTHTEADFRSQLIMLPQTPGQKWIVVEKAKHIIGSCVMHSAALIDKVGGLYQPSIYGFDDVIMSHRTHLAGFYSCFLPHINIDHIDTGHTPYQPWKEKHAGEYMQVMVNLVHEMYNGTKPIYYEL